MSFSFHWNHRAKQSAQLPGLLATARRHAAPLEELAGGPLAYIDIGAGRDVPVVLPRPCGYCWQQKVVYESGPLGLVPLPCPQCSPRNAV